MDRTDIRRIVGAICVTALFLVVAYFAFNQIPHAVRPTLLPSSPSASSPAGKK
jgi:hypothetical protein